VTDEEKTPVTDVAEDGKVDSDTKDTDTKDTVDDGAEDTADDGADTEAAAKAPTAKRTAKPVRPVDWARVVGYGLLPGLALVLALAAGFLKYVDNSVRSSDVARAESM
jgi:Mce-associated membrane protein